MKNMHLILLCLSLLTTSIAIGRDGTSSGGGADGETFSTSIFFMLESEGYTIQTKGPEKIVSISEVHCVREETSGPTSCRAKDDVTGKYKYFSNSAATAIYENSPVVKPEWLSGFVKIKRMVCSHLETFGVQDTRCWIYEPVPTSPGLERLVAWDNTDITCKYQIGVAIDHKRRYEFRCESSVTKFTILCDTKQINPAHLREARFYHIVKGYPNAGPAILHYKEKISLLPCDYK